jgi:hypothetical protein
MNPTDLTPGSFALLEALWQDRHNWAGMPLFGGNVGGSPASLGHLTDLKKKGYVTTEVDYEDPSMSWVIFTTKTEALFAPPKSVTYFNPW